MYHWIYYSEEIQDVGQSQSILRSTTRRSHPFATSSECYKKRCSTLWEEINLFIVKSDFKLVVEIITGHWNIRTITDMTTTSITGGLVKMRRKMKRSSTCFYAGTIQLALCETQAYWRENSAWSVLFSYTEVTKDNILTSSMIANNFWFPCLPLFFSLILGWKQGASRFPSGVVVINPQRILSPYIGYIFFNIEVSPIFLKKFIQKSVDLYFRLHRSSKEIIAKEMGFITALWWPLVNNTKKWKKFEIYLGGSEVQKMKLQLYTWGLLRLQFENKFNVYRWIRILNGYV